MVSVPVILSDLIERVALSRAHLNIVERLGNRQRLARRLTELRPDLVVIGLRRTDSDALVTTLLTLFPKTKFIVFSYDARTVIGYELRVSRTQLSNLSPDNVIDFICRHHDSGGR
jgi:hypothetical protein